MTPDIRRAASGDLDRVHTAYGAAFADEAVASWTGLSSTPEVYRAMIAGVLAGQDEVDVAEIDGEVVGVAVWMPLTSADRVRLESDQFAALAAEHPGLDRAAIAMAEVAAQHPDRPHLFLSSMGVVPGYRGAGVGAAMLRHRLACADAEGAPVYLEASTRQSQRLYARHGFRPEGALIELSEDGPKIQPMWRHPRPSPAVS